jgi:protein O-GlcNAc transferase
MTFEQTVQSALGHHKEGRRDQAEGLYRQALGMERGSDAVMFMLGALLIEKQQLGEALDLLTKATQLSPNVAEYRNALGNALANANRVAEAAAEFARAAELRADYADAYLGLGRALGRLGRSRDAAVVLEKVVALRPKNAAAHTELANALRDMGQSDAALASALRAVELDPKYAWGQNILGLIYRDRGEFDAALAALGEAIRLRPDLSEAYVNMADVHRTCGRLMDSMQALKRAAALSPHDPRPLHNLGVVLGEIGSAEEAISNFRAALALRPTFAEAQSALLLTMNYHPGFTPRQRFVAHAAWAASQPPALAGSRAGRPTGRRVRIGYVSADFCQHPVSWFIEPILAAHDRRRFEVFCYSDVARPDSVTNRLRSRAETWRETAGIGHDALAEIIRRDGIDILVDLAGHTRRNRLAVFARKPAGVQVTYLGYPNTTGLKTMDFRFTDAQADPPGEADYLHSERLVRLPHGFLCYRPPEESMEVVPPPSGAEDGAITFGSFNNMAKFTEEAIAMWAELLAKIPRSRLVLKNSALADGQIAANLAAAFGRLGVDAARLDLRGPTPGIGGHLRTYDLVDIALDTFPYNGTTTTCEALWMGVPVVTFIGNSHAARVGASLLSQVGLSELIGRNSDDYLRIALDLAGDPRRLRELRAGMRSRLAGSPLLNAGQITADIEGAYGAMVTARQPIS